VSPGRIRSLAPERYEVRFTVSAETRAKLREAQDLLGHAVPTGDIAQVVDRALTLLVENLRRRKWAARRPTKATVAVERKQAGSEEKQVGSEEKLARSESVAAVRRDVWIRDGGRCRFIASDRRRCAATRRLEFHHVHPDAAGGPFTVENIELSCRAHNGHEVDRFFGPGVRRGRGGRTDDPHALADRAAAPRGRSGTTPPTTGPGKPSAAESVAPPG